MCTARPNTGTPRLVPAEGMQHSNSEHPRAQPASPHAECADGVSRKFQEQLNQLLVQLPQATTAVETFTTFAQHVQHMFEGLQHISILLLPKAAVTAGVTCPPSKTNSSSSSSSSHSAKAPPAGVPSTSTGSSGRVGSAAAAAAAAAAGEEAPVAAPQAGSSTADLPTEAAPGSLWQGPQWDWGNCCLFDILPGRGPQALPAPAWSLTCTAAYHVMAAGQEVLTTGNFTVNGPHFLDWQAWADVGAVSMAAVPLSSCSQSAGVLCLGAHQENAFPSHAVLQLLAGVLAPYLHLLQSTTRRQQMQRRVAEMVVPIAAQLAQQKNSQLARLGCTVEEASGPAAATTGTVVGAAPASTAAGGGGGGGGGGSAAAAPGESGSMPRSAGAAAATGGKVSRKESSGSRSKKGSWSSSGDGKGVGRRSSSSRGGSEFKQAAAGLGAAGGGSKLPGTFDHKRFESVVVKPQSSDVDPLAVNPHTDLDWGDFFFNLVSMCIVYVYFSKAAVAGESLLAILLCMGVAAFDIVLLLMRWLWFEQYITYGNLVLNLFQVYRMVVLPLANTWMTWSLLQKMELWANTSILVLLGVLLLGCIAAGSQVRFFLQAPLQLASVLFAASSTPDICGAMFQTTESLQCIATISTLQLSLGLVLPNVLMYYLDCRGGRVFLPHMQAKRWLLPRP